MGVDVYLQWEGQTKEEERAQITGFATVGKVGYLRGSYGGGHSATLSDLFSWMDWDDNDSPMSCDLLQNKLDELKEGGEIEEGYVEQVQAFIDLARTKEAEGKKPTVFISY